MEEEIGALVRRARSGDKDAFGQLYGKYFAPLYRFILLKVRHKETAEDLVQSVFAKALANIGEYQERGVPWSAWLYRIATNTVVDFYKKKRDSFLDSDDETVLEIVDPGARTEVEALDRERREALLSALMELGPHEREVVQLRFMEEKSYAEISQMLDVSEEALRATVYRAKKTLRKSLEKYYGNNQNE